MMQCTVSCAVTAIQMNVRSLNTTLYSVRSDQVSHPYKTTDRIIVLYILIFKIIVLYILKIKICRTINQPVVLLGCETWSLTMGKKRKLRVFENRVLRGICGPKRDDVTAEWRKLHNEELNDLYTSPNIVQVIKSRRM